jgi:hypothetical protein
VVIVSLELETVGAAAADVPEKFVPPNSVRGIGVAQSSLDAQQPQKNFQLRGTLVTDATFASTTIHDVRARGANEIVEHGDDTVVLSLYASTFDESSRYPAGQDFSTERDVSLAKTPPVEVHVDT